MSEHNIEAYSSEELEAMRRRSEGKTDWERLAAMKEEDIDFSDIPELDETAWENAQIVIPESEEEVTIRIDSDVLSFFQKEGPDYQSRIKAVLKAYVMVMRGKEGPEATP